MNPWIDEHAARIAAHAERELEALVAISTPERRRPRRRGGGRARGRARPRRRRDRAACRARRPSRARPARAPRGHRAARAILLLGHLDTVVSHDEHQPLRREGDQLVGSGTIDMKGGDVLALGRPARAVAAPRGLRRGRAAARLRRGVAHRRRSPTSSASRASTRACASRPASSSRRRATTRSSSSARRRARCEVRATGRSGALGLGARPRAQRAAGARRRGAGGRRAATTPTAPTA